MRKVKNSDGSVMVFGGDASPLDHEKYQWHYENGQDIDPSMPGAPVELKDSNGKMLGSTAALEAAGVYTRPGVTPNDWFEKNYMLPNLTEAQKQELRKAKTAPPQYYHPTF